MGAGPKPSLAAAPALVLSLAYTFDELSASGERSVALGMLGVIGCVAVTTILIRIKPRVWALTGDPAASLPAASESRPD